MEENWNKTRAFWDWMKSQLCQCQVNRAWNKTPTPFVLKLKHQALSDAKSEQSTYTLWWRKASAWSTSDEVWSEAQHIQTSKEGEDTSENHQIHYVLKRARTGCREAQDQTRWTLRKNNNKCTYTLWEVKCQNLSVLDGESFKTRPGTYTLYVGEAPDSVSIDQESKGMDTRVAGWQWAEWVSLVYSEVAISH
jgi:hypothetical protein